MNFKLILIDKAVAWLLGGELFDFIKDAVATINDEDIPSSGKRDVVFTKAKAFGGTVLSVVVNIGIEVAVLLLKAQASK